MSRGTDPLALLGRSPTLGLSLGQRRNLRRGALWVLLASLAMSALMGIVALVGDDFGDTDANLLLTSFASFAAAAVALACGLAWERGHLGAVPPLGIALGLLGFAVVVYAIWWEPDFEYDFWWKAYFTEILIAVAATHASLVAVSGTPYRRRWASLADYGSLAAYGLNGLGVLLWLIAIWGEVESDGFGRFFAAVMVLLFAVTIAVPVLRRLEGGAATVTASTSAPTLARFCPLCGSPLDPPGVDRCEACGAEFQVRITAP